MKLFPLFLALLYLGGCGEEARQESASRASDSLPQFQKVDFEREERELFERENELDQVGLEDASRELLEEFEEMASSYLEKYGHGYFVLKDGDRNWINTLSYSTIGRLETKIERVREQI